MDKSSAINYRNNLLKDTIELYDLKHCGKKDKNATIKSIVSCGVMSCKKECFSYDDIFIPYCFKFLF